MVAIDKELRKRKKELRALILKLERRAKAIGVQIDKMTKNSAFKMAGSYGSVEKNKLEELMHIERGILSEKEEQIRLLDKLDTLNSDDELRDFDEAMYALIKTIQVKV